MASSHLSLADDRTSWRDPKSVSIGYFAKGPLSAVDRRLIEELKHAARDGGDNARISLHGGPDAAFHEMIIYQHAGRIHPPKKHVHKDKSFHVIEGALAVFVFDDAGNIVDARVLDGKEAHLYRVAAGHYHADIPLGDYVIHHESTTGPFVRDDDSRFAPWGPHEGDHAALDKLREKLLATLIPQKHTADILLTGAAGFCGRHIAAALRATRRTIVGVARHPHEGDIVADLANPAADLPTPIGTVIHTAAKLSVPPMRASDFAADNVEATRRLIEHSLAAGACKFVFFSAMSLYGKVSSLTVNETTPIIAPDAYGASKLLCEQMLAEVADRLPSVSLRLPSVVGRDATLGWLTGVIRKLRVGEEVRFVNPGTPFNNLVHIDDLAAFMGSLVDRRFDGAEAVPLASTEPISVGEVVEILKAKLGSNSTLTATSVPDAPGYIVDDRRARDRYGWTPSRVIDVLDRLVR
jgi:cupin fold WbuC family metalloprotein